MVNPTFSALFASPFAPPKCWNSCGRLKMARSAHAYVRGNTEKFYEWLASRDRESSSTGENASVYVCDGARARGVRATTRAHPRSVHGVTFVTARALFVWRWARREFAARSAEFEIA